ncbi:MAG TPA: hypothetical protein PLZ21_10030, partial [Armatimonadota bacterium]|nr:hypothetical protein [Armatimonadota bacterium]
MQFLNTGRRYQTIVLTILILVLCVSAWCQTFEEILGNFAQRRSGVCVLYAHAMAIAAADPATFSKLVFESYSGAWSVKLNGKRWAYVSREEVDKSIKAGFSAGEPNNILTVFSIAVSKTVGGFNYETGELDYGDGWMKYVGTGNWTLYDNEQGPGKSLKDGLDRLAREVKPDGTPSCPSTMGFGSLDEKTIPDYIDGVRKAKLVGGHDFMVDKYDAENRIVFLRNPHNPKELLEAPVDLLLNIP